MALVGRRVCQCGKPDCRCSPRVLVPPELAGEDWEFTFAWILRRPPDVVGGDVAITPVTRADVTEIAYVADGHGDGPPWIFLGRVADGRWLYVWYLLQITGEMIGSWSVAARKDQLWWSALTEYDRQRFTAQMSPSEREAEVVDLDQLLESRDPAMRELAEKRVLWLRRR
jgi:hypothetical protein